MMEYFFVNSYVFSVSFPPEKKKYNTVKMHENKHKTHQNRCGLVLIKSLSVPNQVSYGFQLFYQLFHSFFCSLITARLLRFLLCSLPQVSFCSVTEVLRLCRWSLKGAATSFSVSRLLIFNYL